MNILYIPEWIVVLYNINKDKYTYMYLLTVSIALTGSLIR